MELKIWVDGIQRVVCGASYTTTCQDVVLALASAMGRTGRFTLVEKWRDSERPLIPSECPLHSLHKWGEYAGEVSYYLVHAEVERFQQQVKSNSIVKTTENNMNTFLHNTLTPATSSRHHLYKSVPECLKRSSTFSGAHTSTYGTLPSSVPQPAISVAISSGAHTSTYGTLPSSVPQPAISVAISQQGRNKQTILPSTSSTKSSQQLGFAENNGKSVCLSPVALSKSPSSSSSVSAKDIPKSCTSRRTLSESYLNPADTFREDERKLYPENMVEPSSQHAGKTMEYSSSFLNRKYPNEQCSVVSSLQSTSSPRAPHSPLTAASKPNYPLSSMHCEPVSNTSSSNSHQSQQQQMSSSSNLPHPQSIQSNQPTHPIPAPRHQTMLSSKNVCKESMTTNHQNSSECKNKFLERNPQNVVSATSFSDVVSARSFCNESSKGNTEKISKAVVSNYYHSNSNEANTALQSGGKSCEVTRENSNVPIYRFPQGLNTSGNTEGKYKYAPISKTHLVKSATLDRHFTRSRQRPALPNRSLSADGDNEHKRSNEEQLKNVQPASDTAQIWRKGEEKISSIQNSAGWMKQHGSVTDSFNNKRMSSFSSAVAHIHQSSEDVILKQSKTGTHVRQHSSDSSKIDNHFQRELTQSIVNMPSRQYQNYVGYSNSKINNHNDKQQYKNNAVQQSSKKTSPPLNSIFYSQHNSAIPEALRLNHHESSLSSSHADVTYTINNSELKQHSLLCTNNIHQSQENYKSGKVNFNQDRSLANSCTKDVRSEIPDRYLQPNPPEKNIHRTSSISIQEEEEYRELLRIVQMQQEKMKVQEAQIHDASMEISTFEEDLSSHKIKLEAIVEEVSNFDKQETYYKNEFENVEIEDYISVLDREKKLEADVKLKIINLKEKLKTMESQIKQLNEEHCKKNKDLKSEEMERNDFEKKQTELEGKVILDIKHLEKQLEGLNKITDENNHKLKDVNTEIFKTEADLKQKEEKVKVMEEKLNDETKNNNSNISSAHSIVPALAVSGTAFPISENGEAILRLLDRRLSSPTSFTVDEIDNLGGVTSAQHVYSSVIVVKNPNGVWV